MDVPVAGDKQFQGGDLHLGNQKYDSKTTSKLEMRKQEL